jgi:hypothetical protein
LPSPELKASTIIRRPGIRQPFRLVLFALMAVALIGIVLIATHHPDDERARMAAENFIVTMRSNDPDRAYAMGNEAFRSATTEEKLGGLFDQVEPFLRDARIDKVDSYYAVSTKGEPRAIFVYTANKANNLTYIRIVTDKQGDSWLIHSLITKAQPLQAKPE